MLLALKMFFHFGPFAALYHAICNHAKFFYSISGAKSSKVFFILFQAQKAQKLTQSFYSASSSTLAIQDGKEAGQTIEQVQLQLECVQLQANSMCVKYHLSTLNLRCRTPYLAYGEAKLGSILKPVFQKVI